MPVKLRTPEGRSYTISDAEIEAAYRRGARRLATEPLATAVRYDARLDRVIIEINNGAALVIPRRLMQGLSDATAEQLSRGEVWTHGLILAWPEVDAHFTVMGLLKGIYGGRRWISELARHAGSATSPAKAAAARANGKKGGWPKIAAAGSKPGVRTQRKKAKTKK